MDGGGGGRSSYSSSSGDVPSTTAAAADELPHLSLSVSGHELLPSNNDALLRAYLSMMMMASSGGRNTADTGRRSDTYVIFSGTPYDWGANDLRHAAARSDDDDDDDEAYGGFGFGAVPASGVAMACLPETTVGECDGDGDGDGECAVCLEEYEAGDALRTMPCAHGFHERCIFQWLRASRLCPLCRFALPAEPDEEEDTDTDDERDAGGHDDDDDSDDDDDDYYDYHGLD